MFIFLFLQCYFLVGGRIIYDGNSYDIANVYFRRSASAVDTVQLFNHVRVCKVPQFSGFRCIQNNMRPFGVKSRLWNPSDDQETDCKYDLKLENVTRDSEDIIFLLIIRQSMCNLCSNIPGGSTFNVHAYNNLAVVSCYVNDELQSDNYLVFCRFPIIGQYDEILKPEMKPLLCVSVTAILTHEHFDSYSEVLMHHGLEQAQLLYPVANNVTFCARLQSHSDSRPTLSPVASIRSVRTSLKNELEGERSDASLSSLTLPSGVAWFSGNWLSDEVISQLNKGEGEGVADTNSGGHSCRDDNSCYTSLLEYESSMGIVNLAYDYKLHHSQLTDINAIKNAYNATSLVQAPPEQLADLFSYVPSVTVQSTNSSLPQTRYIASSRMFEAEKLAINSNNWTFVFVGSSHMRYNFDFLVTYLLGSEHVRHLNNHHDDITVGKYTFDNTMLADIQAEVLRLYCQAPASKDSKRMMFLQTGHWDMTFFGLRYIMQTNDSSIGGLKLINVIESIFSGNLSCPSIAHLVWMTPTPYPICYFNRGCENDRLGRTNANFEALSTNYLKSLLSAYNAHPSAKSRVQFSVIDAYNVVLPRLLFNEDNEVAFNHYVYKVSPYRIENNLHRNHARANRHRNHTHKHSIPEQVTIVTPGGSAVLQSMLHVMKWAGDTS